MATMVDLTIEAFDLAGIARDHLADAVAAIDHAASTAQGSCENSRSDWMNLRPCARVPLRLKLNTAPQPRGSRRWAPRP